MQRHGRRTPWSARARPGTQADQQERSAAALAQRSARPGRASPARPAARTSTGCSTGSRRRTRRTRGSARHARAPTTPWAREEEGEVAAQHAQQGREHAREPRGDAPLQQQRSTARRDEGEATTTGRCDLEHGEQVEPARRGAAAAEPGPGSRCSANGTPAKTGFCSGGRGIAQDLLRDERVEGAVGHLEADPDGRAACRPAHVAPSTQNARQRRAATRHRDEPGARPATLSQWRHSRRSASTRQPRPPAARARARPRSAPASSSGSSAREAEAQREAPGRGRAAARRPGAQQPVPGRGEQQHEDGHATSVPADAPESRAERGDERAHRRSRSGAARSAEMTASRRRPRPPDAARCRHDAADRDQRAVGERARRAQQLEADHGIGVALLAVGKTGPNAT